MRVGVFGGSFDPPHSGHLEVAKAAKIQGKLDKVLFIPAKQSPLKDKEPITKNRIELLEDLIKGVDGFEVDLSEINRPSPSFTIDTLNNLKTSDSELFLIIGADSAAEFTRWSRYKEIISIVSKILVYPRNSLKFDLLPKMELLEGAEIPISSTDLRRVF